MKRRIDLVAISYQNSNWLSIPHQFLQSILLRGDAHFVVSSLKFAGSLQIGEGPTAGPPILISLQQLIITDKDFAALAYDCYHPPTLLWEWNWHQQETFSCNS